MLADRDLGDAVRSLALDIVLDVEVHLSGRLPSPMESAAYFAVNEALTNAAKHTDARTVRVILTHDGSTQRVVVSDHGHGGADSPRPDAPRPFPAPRAARACAASNAAWVRSTGGCGR
ncbi:ATP-binding protein [Plantactinospora sp. ZYX-F-223]|uniref:ATP-binding protein n=1 Tax=Plantactinospora sp. ZYX-F-223 TaxID=3144103 RepID=UPI0031FD8A3B